MIQVFSKKCAIVRTSSEDISKSPNHNYDDGNPLWRLALKHTVAISAALRAWKWSPWVIYAAGIGLGFVFGPLVAQSFHLFLGPGSIKLLPTGAWIDGFFQRN
jgi:hypothetical protein